LESYLTQSGTASFVNSQEVFGTCITLFGACRLPNLRSLAVHLKLNYAITIRFTDSKETYTFRSHDATVEETLASHDIFVYDEDFIQTRTLYATVAEVLSIYEARFICQIMA